MYSIKFIPYPYTAEKLDKHTHVLSADEYKWCVKYAPDRETLKEILDENREFRVIWELPLRKSNFPDGGIQLVLLTIYKSTNPEGYDSLKVNTYIAYDCSVFVMNENGKTIDRIG